MYRIIKQLSKGLLLVAFSLCIMACSNDDDIEQPVQNKTIIRTNNLVKTINDVSGVIYYDTEHNCWYILCALPNSIDSADLYYVDDLADSFKVNATRVIISGDVYEISNDDMPPIGGHKYYFIELNTIKEQTK